MDRGPSSRIKPPRFESRDDFLRALSANPGYIRLTKIRSFDRSRRRRLEDACWRHYCIAKQAGFAGAPARRALLYIDKLRDALENPNLWLPSATIATFDRLENTLKTLTSRAKRGRPSDDVARVFRQSMYTFVPVAAYSQRTKRWISREESDEIFAELFTLVFGRRVSTPSFTRMRMRDQSRNPRDRLATETCTIANPVFR